VCSSPLAPHKFDTLIGVKVDVRSSSVSCIGSTACNSKPSVSVLPVSPHLTAIILVLSSPPLWSCSRPHGGIFDGRVGYAFLCPPSLTGSMVYRVVYPFGSQVSTFAHHFYCSLSISYSPRNIITPFLYSSKINLPLISKVHLAAPVGRPVSSIRRPIAVVSNQLLTFSSLKFKKRS
jgi:hypothetical protein